ncbi:hypothetical protein Btru_032113, partial [Bulinus truncatus]
MAHRYPDHRSSCETTTEELQSTYYDLADEEVRDKGSQNKATLGHSVKKKNSKVCPVNEGNCLDKFSTVILPSYKTSAYPRSRDHVTLENESTKGGGECRQNPICVRVESEGSCEAFHSATAIGQCMPDDSESLYSIQSGRPKKSTSTDSELNVSKNRVVRSKRNECHSSRYRRRSLSAEKNARRVRYPRDGRVTKFGNDEDTTLKTLKISGYSDSRTHRTKSTIVAMSRRRIALDGNSAPMKHIDDHGETISPKIQLEFRPLTDSSTISSHDVDAEKKIPGRYDLSKESPGKNGVPDRRLSTRSPNSSSGSVHRSRENDRVYNKRPTVSSRSSNLSSNTNDSANNTANNTSMAVGEISSLDDEHAIHQYCSSRKAVDLTRLGDAVVNDQYVGGGRLAGVTGQESQLVYSLHSMKNRHYRVVSHEDHEVMDDTSSNAGGRDKEELATFRQAPLLARNKYMPHDRTHLYEDCTVNPAKWSSSLPERLNPSSLMSERARLSRRSRRLRFGDSKHYLDHSILYGSQKYRVPKKDKPAGSLAAQSGKSRAAKSSKAASESTKSEHPSGSSRKKTDRVPDTHNTKGVRPGSRTRGKAGQQASSAGTGAPHGQSKGKPSPQATQLLELFEAAVSGDELDKPSTSGRPSASGQLATSARPSLVRRPSTSLMPSTSGRPLDEILKDVVDASHDQHNERTTERRRSSLNTGLK